MINKKNRKPPNYIEHLPPCNNACPTGANIQLWLKLVKAGQLQEAWQAVLLNNPFPACCGRVCYHFCESHCNRTLYDNTVNIHAIERFLGDQAIVEKWSIASGKTTGKHVLIVGAGPAGLTAAYYLRRFGHAVTIYEALPKAGGMMLVGIPRYRLPRAVLQGEIQHILNMDVKIEYNRKVTDILAEKVAGKFDAIFLAIGAHLGKNLAFTAIDPCPVIDAIEYLREVELNAAITAATSPGAINRIIIYGGGNTAIDVARTAKRVGVKDVNIVYHRTQAKMPAFPAEVEEALEEGVKFHFLRTILQVAGSEITLSINELDDKGAPRPTGQTEVFGTDLLVLALSQITASEFLRKVPGVALTPSATVIVDSNMMTGCPGIFAGGDMVPYDRSVTVAIGHGKKAARHIDAYLRGTNYVGHEKNPLATYEKLHISAAKSAKIEQNLLDAASRVKSFDEIAQGISKEAVEQEANRCFSCGNCFECDGCYTVCPVKAITKLGVGKGYKIDADKCIRCGKCVRRCPCGAIEI
jgi:formate dehydrogenase (NADP+) beta subunit